MKIPTKGRARFASELIAQCTASRAQRINRGAAFRNLYYTGDWEGRPQTFLRTQDLVRDLSAFLYSCADLRFALDFYGMVSPVDRAKGKAVAAHLYQKTREARVDSSISQAVLSSLIKGKVIHQTVWTRSGFEPYVIQPELFGVEREDFATLDRQEFFCHSTFMSRSRFRQMISALPGEKQAQLMKGANRYAKSQSEGDAAATASVLKQIMVGGIAPYTSAGQQGVASGGQVLNWLYAPQAVMRPDVVEDLIPYDELWVWNDREDDWVTMTLVGDMLVFGENVNYNAFAEQYRRSNNAMQDKENGLRGKHGFVEFAPLPMEDYFWGFSAVSMVTLLQKSINNRIDGINRLLRFQEDPPRMMTGSQSVNQNTYAKLNKPGGYANDGNPNAKFQELLKEIPKDLWVSFHELNAMFDMVAGFPAVTKGEGEAGVRSQGHADTLLRMGTARHKEAALEVERSVEEIAGLMLSILQARDVTKLVAWVKPSVQSIEIDDQPDPSLEPPAKGMKQVTFNLWHLPENVRVTTDGHSQSPAFSQEAKLTAMALNQRGAMGPARLVEALHPPNAEALVEDIDQKEIEQAELIQQHPELLEKALGGGKKKHH